MNDEKNKEQNIVSLVQQTADWKEQLTTVTPLSKYLAMVLFIALPFIGFWAGMKYGAADSIDSFDSTPIDIPVVQEVTTEVLTEESVSIDVVEDWKKYSSVQYGFEIDYPPQYQMMQDTTGWPHSIFLLAAPDSQSYDLVVDVWNSREEMENAKSWVGYTSIDDLIIKDLPDGRIIVFFNQNRTKEIDAVISSFRLLQ